MFKRLSTLLLILLIPNFACAAKTNFVDGNKATGTKGTVVTASFLNGVNNHRHDGAASDGSGVLDYYVDGGNGTHLIITPSPALAAHVVGMPIYVKVGYANPGSATITVGSLSPVPLTRMDGSPLQRGDLLGGMLVAIAYDGSGYRLLTGTATNANQLNGDRIVRGYVAEDGSTPFGTGGRFTVTHNGPGSYTINFNPAFNSAGLLPQAFVNVHSLAAASGSIQGSGFSSVTIYIFNAGGAQADGAFDFMVVGPN